MKTRSSSPARGASDAALALVVRCVAALVGFISLVSFNEARASVRARAGGDTVAVDACTLLALPEIQNATGIKVKPGVLQTTDDQSDCEWDGQDARNNDAGVSLTVAKYDDKLFKTLGSAKNATPVSGIGETAFKGIPHAGDLMFKKGAYMVTVGIVDFSSPKPKVDDAAAKLAQLVLSRL